MPENSQLSLVCFSVFYGFHGLADTEKLVVAGDDLCGFSGAFVKQDEVLKDVNEVLFGADAFQEGFKFNHAFIPFSEPFPFAEMSVFSGYGADFAFIAVAQDDQGVVMEDVGNGVFVVAQVVDVRGFDVFVDVFKFNEQKRDAVDKADNVRPSAVRVSLNP